MKTQTIRLIDVFLIGPGMIYIATFSGAPIWIRYAIMFAGVATILYNLKNYLLVQKNPNLDRF